MHASLYLTPAALMLGAVLCGCVAVKAPRTPAPPATDAQVEKEMQYLKQHFLTDDCMTRLRKAAPELTAKDKQGDKAIYAVEFPPNTLAVDGHTYRLQVTERERLAYLHTSGGTGGWYTVHGPLPLWQCLQGALK
jgi:hypothetical protein